MKKLAFGLLIVLVFSAFVSDEKDIYTPVNNSSFSRGEEIHFKMTYGIFNVGKGSAKIHPDYFKVNGRDCFKVEVTGKTVGMVDWVADVNDQWGAYIDTAALVPHQFFRKIREGRYKKDEWTDFDHQNKKIQVKSLDKKGNMKAPKMYEAPPLVRDMISGFLYLRVMDFSKLKVNDTVLISGFFEDEFYKLKIVYRGKDKVRLKIGKVNALKFVPLMPDNKVFEGENSITAWFSDDKNRIPLKIDADMFIGSAGVELISYKNLRNPLNLVK
jgi:hypothetical protein